MNGLFGAWRQILENEKLMDDYRDFMDFGVVEEGRQARGGPGAPMRFGSSMCASDMKAARKIPSGI